MMHRQGFTLLALDQISEPGLYSGSEVRAVHSLKSGHLLYFKVTEPNRTNQYSSILESLPLISFIFHLAGV